MLTSRNGAFRAISLIHPRALVLAVLFGSSALALLGCGSDPSQYGRSHTERFGSVQQALTAAWTPNTAYSAGDQVTYGGNTYQAVQAHTSQTGWEPPNTPALWTIAPRMPTAAMASAEMTCSMPACSLSRSQATTPPPIPRTRKPAATSHAPSRPALRPLSLIWNSILFA